MSLTRYVVDFMAATKPDQVPDTVLKAAKRSILDGLGLALAGQAAQSGRIVHEYLSTLGSSNQSSTVIGSGLSTAARFAAFANGVAIHADDYDDTQLAVGEGRVYGLLTHPTAPVLPAALALSEQNNASGRQLLDAYVFGVEIECKVAEAINPRHYQDGFHSTGTIGAIGAASAAARLLNYDPDTAARALSIGASQSAGLRENFGTMTKPFHAGKAAENGVFAAEMAGLGWTAASTILEADRGFFHAAGGGYDAALIDGKLGAPWTFDSPGVSIKPHPSGSLTHPGMGLLLDLIVKNDIQPEQVDTVKVGTNRHMPNALIHHRPATELEAKFSMEFCMAILLLERKAGLAEFTDEVVNRQDVQGLIEKVEFGVHPEAEGAGYDKMTTIIDIALSDGRVISGRADFGKGSPANPMTDAELAAKFHECAEWGGLSRDKVDQVTAMVYDLEGLPSVRELTSLLTI